MAECDERMTKTRPVDDRVEMIVTALNAAKAKTIKRINKQLARMSPNDVAVLERLIGKR